MLTPRLRFRLLGPLEVEIDGRPVALTGRQRALCTALLLHANHVVSVDRLIDCLWDSRPPGAGAARVRALVAEVRRLLGPAGPTLLTTRSPGYVLHAGPGELDLLDFERLVEDGSRAAADGDWDTVRHHAEQALGLWRGEPLSDLPEAAVREAEGRRLGELHLAVRENAAEADLETGRPSQAIAELLRLTTAHPLRERPHALLMRALQRDGRPAEALQVYADLRRRLVDELALEPSDELRTLHRRLLAGDDPPTAPPTARAATFRAPTFRAPAFRAPASPAPPERRVPRQLPPVPRRFVGRDEELRRLDACLRTAEPLALLVGPAGVGKSALALRWAHQVADRFPDGQLFLDLRGFDDAEPMGPDEALPLLLQGLGCGPRDIPLGTEAQTALYRTLLADRRVLVVLDDAADAATVRLLRPASTGSLALVTSRDKLSGLVTLDGAYRVSCEVLEHTAALELISSVVGAETVAADPEAAAELVELCDRLPLALCVAGSWIGGRPGGIRTYVRELADRGRLARLHVEGEESVAVRAALDLSYGALPDAARRVFRQLGLVPGTGRSVRAAAAAARVDETEAADLLRLAQRVHLLHDVGHGRTAWHDLVHEYARDRTAAEDTAADRAAAVERVLDHYVQSVVNGATTAGLYVMRDRPTAVEGSLPREFGTAEEVYDWFDAEWDDIAAAIAHAAEHGPARFAWMLVDALQDLFHHRRPLADWMRLAVLARAGAEREADLRGQVAMRVSLGHARWRDGDLRGALAEYEQAEEAARRADWTHGEAVALQGRAVTLKLLGEPLRALPCYRRALALYRTLGDVKSEVIMLINTASLNLALGRIDAAEEAAASALALIGEAAHHHRAMALVNLALVRQKQARFAEAEAALRTSFVVCRDSGSTYAEAVALETLGRVRADAGQDARALAAYEDALAVSLRAENRNCQVDSLVGLAALELRGGRAEEAAGHLDAAFEIAERTGHRAGHVGILLERAAVARAAGRPDAALDHLERAADLAVDGNPLTLPHVLVATAVIRLEAGDPTGALEMAGRAHTLAQESGQRLIHARAALALAAAHEAQGDTESATAARARATALFDATGTPPEARAALPGPPPGPRLVSAPPQRPASGSVSPEHPASGSASPQHPPAGSAHPRHPARPHRRRELPADAKARLDLYLAEHFSDPDGLG